MLVLQGSAWLSIKLEKGDLRDKAMRYGLFAGLAVILLFAIGFVFVRFSGLGFHVTGDVTPDGPSNPTRATVVPLAGAWLLNYGKYPWMWAAPLLGFAGPAIAMAGLRLKNEWLAFGGSSLGITGVIATVGCSMFPIILPSTIDAHSSLLVWTASSSHMTLGIMLLVTAVLLPLVLFYTAWVYKVLFGRVGVGHLKTNPDLY